MATIFWLSVYGVHIGATWRIRLDRPCVAAMRPYVKLLWPLVKDCHNVEFIWRYSDIVPQVITQLIASFTIHTRKASLEVAPTILATFLAD